ncbi:CYTH domain-containing protein [Bacillus sp. 1NLA3E]|uniref:CYTH domain-containing protein n=1 Tax=Bacillus sp. 1NLA3E TaxID=666686 RepID=UPI000247E387|nr:CYTH domain-containing protein [Bacillus sp. 1NLA3E]AGK52744.1 RNA/thiamine triphosphatase [Bacillus sp. 1NLA3E]
MSQHLEIEFKNLLTKQEYNHLIEFFKVDKINIKKQINHYFDTASFLLKDAQSALRIRERGDWYEMTLKQPAPIGLLETNQILQKQEAAKLLDHHIFPDGPIKDKLLSIKVPVELLQYFGSLTTNRIEFAYKDGLLVLDHSYYLNAEDFEIEYEVTNPDIGEMVFNELLHTMKIPRRKTENKVQRFYNQKYQS